MARDPIADRILFEYRHLLEPSMTLRGMPPTGPQSMVPNMEPLTPPIAATANVSPEARMYRAMGEGPSMIERLTGGGKLPVPNTPIKHKNVNSRSFLRGLVGGLNNAAGLKADERTRGLRQLMMEMRGGGGAAGMEGLTPYQQASLSLREKADLRAEAAGERSNRLMESLIGQRGFQQQEAGRDNQRADAQLGVSQGHLEIARANLALARQRESRMAASAKARMDAAGASYEKWPEMWKREFSAKMAAINDADRAAAAAAAEAGTPYDGSVADRRSDELIQRFIDRHIAAGGKPEPTYFDDSRMRGNVQSGVTTTGGSPSAPAPTTAVPKKGSW